MAKRVAEITDGKFQIRVFAAGEIVPALQVLDAVQAGTTEMGHTAPYYYFGKDPAFAFGTAVCFGMNARQQNAWWYFGGGAEAMAPLFKDYGCVPLLCGNTGCQMGGWWRKEIKSVADMQGVKMRIGGMAGLILAKLGVVPQQLGAPDIYPALEKGTIDAAEWVGPYDDEKLGFNKVAKFYYYPGFWEGGPMVMSLVNEKKWNELPKAYQVGAEHRVRRSHRLDAGEVRRAESAGAATSGRERHRAEAIPEGRDGGGRESLLRGIRRDEREERALQAHLPRVEEVPRRAVPVVPCGGIHLRQLRLQLEARRGQRHLALSLRMENPAAAGFFISCPGC